MSEAGDNARDLVSVRGRWLALLAAVLGWAFDGFEMGVFALIAQPALGQLLPQPTEADVGRWYGLIQAGFLVGAATGGVLFGWIGDRFGRVRAMILSILTYALCTALGAFATSAEQLGACRFVAALGMGGEWSLGLALVMEIWPQRSRPWLAGVIGASVNLGFMGVALVSLSLAALLGGIESMLHAWSIPQSVVDWLMAARGWRLLLLTGAFPALLTLFIRWAVPESWQWEAAAAAGATRHWSNRDLVGILAAAGGGLTMIAAWASELPLTSRLGITVAGYLLVLAGCVYPVRSYYRRRAAAGVRGLGDWFSLRQRLLMGAVLSGVPLLGTWGAIQWIPLWTAQMAGPAARDIAALVSALGGGLGGVAAALAANRWGWRRSYAVLCLAAGLSTVGLFQLSVPTAPGFLLWVFASGVCAGSFTGWLPFYLPTLFPTPVRSISQGFAFNHGRILAALGTLQVGTLLGWFGGYPAACTAACGIYALGLALCPWTPGPWAAPGRLGQHDGPGCAC